MNHRSLFYSTQACRRGVALALSLGACLFGSSQVAPADPVVELDTLEVTGQRYASRLALETKRSSTGISDSVASDDVGKLPDHNVADVLRRLPGVTTLMDEGEGRYVSIRGMGPEFAAINLDGVKLSSIAAPWDTIARATALEAVPAAALQTVVVKKSLTPDMDGDAIAGTVELVTGSAFSHDGTFISATGAIADYAMTEMPRSANGLSYKTDLAFSTVAGADQQFGLSGSFNYNLRDSDELKTIRTGYATLPSGADQTGDYWNYIYGNERERIGGAFKFEFRPQEDWLTSLSLHHYEQVDDEVKWGHFLRAIGKHDEAAGTITGATGRARYFSHYIARQTTTATLSSEFTFANDSRLSFKGNVSQSEWTQPNDFVEYNWSGPALNGTFDNSGDLDRYDLDAASDAAFEDPQNYSFSQYQQYFHGSDEDSQEFKLDWGNLKPVSGNWGYKVGLKSLQRDYAYDYRRLIHRNSNALNSFVEASDWTAPGMTNTFVFVNPETFLNAFDPQAAGWTGPTIDETGRDYFASESVLAGYAMASYANYKSNLLFGVRYEATDWDAASYQNGTGGPLVSRDGSYDNVLPSILWNYKIRDDLVLRAAYAKSLGRPDYKDLGSPETFDSVDGNIRRANPDLRPRRSDNYDLSLDYYLANDLGLISGAIFQKDIVDEIYSLTETYTYTDPVSGAINPDATISQPVNSGDAQVRGFEFSYEKSRFDFMPAPFDNLGLSVNWTRTDGELAILNASGAVQRQVEFFVNQPENVYNATLFYSSVRFEARVAYNHTDKYYGSFNGSNPDNDDRWDARSQWDVHGRYNLDEHWTFFADLSNLTNEKRLHRYGDRRLREIVDFGRSIWIGATYRY